MNMNYQRVFSYISYSKSRILFRKIEICRLASTWKLMKNSKLDEDVAERLESQQKDGKRNIRSTPGTSKFAKVYLPWRYKEALKILFENKDVEKLISEAENYKNYINARQPMSSPEVVKRKARKVFAELQEKEQFNEDDDDDSTKTLIERVRDDERKENQLKSRLRRELYHWQRLQFSDAKSLLYLVCRMMDDYSSVLSCLREISKRDPSFQPDSLYNYGSKLGTTVWAANKVWKTIEYYMCVDNSNSMLNLASLLLKGGHTEGEHCIKGVYFRKYGPSPLNHKYPVVVCPYMLMEEKTKNDRKKLVDELWEMTESYLILLEIPTLAGFTLIEEAKNHILELNALSDPSVQSHVFAPCPHDHSCPKIRMFDKPCVTKCWKKDLNFMKMEELVKKKQSVQYSYVILKKGKRESDKEWPRIVNHNSPNKQVYVHLCLPSGEYQEVVIARSTFDRGVYNCAKASSVGDRLPVSMSSEVTDEQLLSEVDTDKERDPNSIGKILSIAPISEQKQMME